MKVSKTLLILQSAIILLCSCNSDIQKTQSEDCGTLIEYYSTIPLRESPYPDFKGIVRLSEEEALNRNHYRFEYDDKFRLQNVSFRLGNTLRNPNHTSNYFFTTPIQNFEYKDGKEIRTFYDRFGNQTTQRGVFKEIYTINHLGKKINLHFEDNKGNKIENAWGISDYIWEHKPDGSVIESRYDLKGAMKSLRPHFEFNRIRLFYEQNGMLSLMQNIDSQENLFENNSGVAQDNLIFDKEGRWLGWNVLNKEHKLHRGNGPNVAKGINISNNFGYEVSIRYEDIDGSPIINAHGFWGGKRFYDKYGNYDYTHFIDSLGNPGINENSGYCYAIYSWDKRGINRQKIEFLDTNKMPILRRKGGYSIIQYEYNENDNLITTSYLGLEGEKINRKDNGVCYIVYKYNNDNALTETKRYNKSDEPIE